MPDLQTLEVPIQGMDCAECTMHVQHAIAALPGVDRVDVFLASEKAVVRLDLQQVDLPAIQQAVARAGYTVPTANGLEVISEANGWSFWVYGGTAINIFFIKVDLSAMYNFLNGDYGASVNLRLQL